MIDQPSKNTGRVFESQEVEYFWCSRLPLNRLIRIFDSLPSIFYTNIVKQILDY